MSRREELPEPIEQVRQIEATKTGCGIDTTWRGPLTARRSWKERP